VRWVRQFLPGRKQVAMPPLRLGKYCRVCQLERNADCRKVAYGSARLRNEAAALSKATFGYYRTQLRLVLLPNGM